jgi:hypothetical protein
MSIRYYINPELNIILFVGKEIVTGSEYFRAANMAAQDKLRKWGMVTIIDILSMETDFELQDLKHAIAINNTLPEKGLEPEQVIALTESKGMHFVGEAMKALSNKIPIKFEVASTLDEVISLLNIPERKQEFISFYNKCKLES